VLKSVVLLEEKRTGGGRESGSDAWKVYMQAVKPIQSIMELCLWHKESNLICSNLKYII
jgi:hypothetical protein